MKLVRVKDYEEMSDLISQIFIEKLKSLEKPILGLATGSTPMGLYERLINKYEQNEISFKHVTTFNLDEYVGLSDDHPASYHYFMKEKLFNHIDLPKERAHVPSGVAQDLDNECQRYEALIRQAGQIDLQLLGIGTNGHIGFNEPGTPFDSRTAVFDLTETTRRSNARFFNSLNEVPSKAISMGLGTIMDAKEIVLIVSGKVKAEIMAKVLTSKPTIDIPATVLHLHERVTVIADEEALSSL